MITTTRTCDKCKKVIEPGKPYWIMEMELCNEPNDMEKFSELDSSDHVCLNCKPLGEYKKREVKKEE